jgi:hypothetical protein
MNVSITLDATISRTRLETGATVVRVDAIALGPGYTGMWAQVSFIAARPSLSLLPERTSVNEE